MANIFTSSIGKKLIMSITGAFLIMFLTFHMVMNAALLFSDEAYDAIVRFLGANWYALVGTAVLAAGVFIHFLYAFILTAMNLKARGKIRYAESKNEPGIEWASKNMLVLGIIVVCGLLLHMFNFWFNMQWTEIVGEHTNSLGYTPYDGAAMVRELFANPIYVGIYLVWFAALWFHLTHGFWSMLQTVGWNSKVWMKRLRCISYVIATIIVGGFACIMLVLFAQSFM